MTTTEEIKQRLDLVEVIQGYAKLTQAGQNWKARCPFHNEKTASFMVSRDKGIWHCFGCGKGGDVFTFVQEIEGMEFTEALQFLAAKAGVVIQREDPKRRSRRERLFDIMAFSVKVYHRLLLEHEKAEGARQYLRQRGVSDDMIETFQIGYAPESWEGVSTFLQSRKFTDEEIFLAGLTVKRERGSGYYDRFRHRIMFPIADHLGRYVGFGGRALEATQTPKYVNTPQTELYNKSAILFALNRAKTAIKDQQLAVVVEGYMDALASHQAGVTNVVAASGTALTRDQVRLLKRYTENIALGFDTDLAGETASMRGIEMAWEEGMNVRVIVQPFGKDPDELIKKDPAAWTSAITAAQPIMEYAFARAEKNFDATTVEGKKKTAKFLLPLIGRLKDAIEQTHYLQQLARRLAVSEDILRSRLPHPAGQSQRPSPPQKTVATAPPKDRAQRVAEQLLAIALQHPEHLEYLIDHLEPDYLAPTTLLGLYKALLTHYTEKHHLDQQEFLQLLGREDPELAKQANVIFLLGTSDLLPQEERLRKQEVLDGLAVLRRMHIQRKLHDLQRQLAVAEERNDASEVQRLSALVSDMTQELSDGPPAERDGS